MDDLVFIHQLRSPDADRAAHGSRSPKFHFQANSCPLQFVYHSSVDNWS